MEVVEGRRLVELRPRIDVDKGTALLDLISEYAPTSVIYAGDDRTDLDAFRALHHWVFHEDRRAAAVAVVSPEMPTGLLQEADLTVQGVKGMAAFLARLVDAVSTWSSTET